MTGPIRGRYNQPAQTDKEAKTPMSSPTPAPINVLITTYLEPEHIERLRGVSPRLNILYFPELIAPARYPADHYNTIERSPEQEERWRELLAQADVLFDFDPTHRADLPELAPNVRWVQAANAGSDCPDALGSAGSTSGSTSSAASSSSAARRASRHVAQASFAPGSPDVAAHSSTYAAVHSVA